MIRRCPPALIGVVGGMGPHAGVDFVRKVLDQTLASRDQDHLPLALLSLPSEIPDRTRFLLGEEPWNPAVMIAELLGQLETLGVTVAGIPCNTSHSPRIFGAVRASLCERGSRVKLLNMVEEAVRFAKVVLPAHCCVGILSTNGTARTGLYRDAFRNEAFRLVALTDAELDDLVHRSIYDPDWGLKACANPVSAMALARLTEAARRLQVRGAQALVLACTELPLAFPSATLSGMSLIDPGVALARALVRSVRPERLKPLAQAKSALPRAGVQDARDAQDAQNAHGTAYAG